MTLTSTKYEKRMNLNSDDCCNLLHHSMVVEGRGSGCTTAPSEMHHYLYCVYCLTPPTSVCSNNKQNLHRSTVKRIPKQFTISGYTNEMNLTSLATQYIADCMEKNLLFHVFSYLLQKFIISAL